MVKRIFQWFILLTFLSVLVTVTPAAPVEARTNNNSILPYELVKPDGTLALDGNFNGSLDLTGWNVQMDAQRGPLLSRAGKSVAMPLDVPAVGDWEALGEGGSAFGYYISSIVIVGSDVFVGGGFQNADSIPEADYIARWDGSAWHALSSNGNRDGSLKNVVYTLYHDGAFLYVGGNFTDVNNNGAILSAADCIARWDGTNWSAMGNNGGPGNGSLNSQVRSITGDGTNIYVGGSFTNVNNNGTVLSEADNLAMWDGSNWSALGNSGAGVGAFDKTVWALDLYGSTLYAGGDFTNAGGDPEADFIAKWNGATWSALGNNGAGDGAFDLPSDHVYSLAVDSTGLVYAGGNFNNVNNGATNLPDSNNLVVWNGSSWSAVGTNGVDYSISSNVSTIVIDGSDNVYIGGYFVNVKENGTAIPTADKIAIWDGSNWSALGSNGSGDGSINKPANVNPAVFAIALDGNKVYAGGYFEDTNNAGTLLPQADHFAVWNAGHWEAVSSNPNGPIQNAPNPLVNAIAVLGNDVYVGGSFTDIGDALGVNQLNLDYIARWDGSQWNDVGSGLSNSVESMLIDGTDLYVGGSFTDAGGNATADYLAKWNGVTWSAVGNNGAGNGSLNSSVSTLAMYGGELYAGGNFTNVVNVDTAVLADADYLARWSGSNWRPVNNGFGNPLNNKVNALEATASGLYVGGSFDAVNGIAEADFIALWDGGNWSAVGSNGAGDGAITNAVFALESIGTDLYAGGDFLNVAGISQADFVARWDGANWSALGSNLAGTDGSLNSTVRALTHYKNKLYVGGDFINVSDSGGDLPAADYIAQWNGSHWSALGSNGNGDGSLNKRVNALAMGNALYVGGLFSDVNHNGALLPKADYVTAFGVYTTIKLSSTGTQDGWILESTETSNKGGAINSTATLLYAGDDAQDKQYRSILSFNTAGLPDNAVITKVQLKLKIQGFAGGNMFTPTKTLGNLLVDIRKSNFGSSVNLAINDFQAGANKGGVGVLSTAPSTGWYTITLKSTSFSSVNLSGTTQFRLRFQKDDNDDAGADYLKIYSGNAPSASRPALIVEYHAP